MCRYAFAGPYRGHYACFACRKSFKWPRDRNARADSLPHPRCPECGVALEEMGLDFKAPRRSDVSQWTKVETLARHGVRYFSCGCGPGPRPKDLRDVEAFLANRLPPSEGERLLQRIEARARRHPTPG